MPPLGQLAPVSSPCRAFINPVYKYIFLRGTKVAGTSVANALGNLCPDGKPTTADTIAQSVRLHKSCADPVTHCLAQSCAHPHQRTSSLPKLQSVSLCHSRF